MNKNNTNAVNTTTFNTRLLNTTKLNTIGFPVLSKRSGSSDDISQAIMDSLVCWYDIGKQQCTNESMASNPVLADLSGNGHDITCYNFAWSGMSGVGGFVYDVGNIKLLYKDKVSITGNKITLNSKPENITAGSVMAITTNVTGEVNQQININIPAFKIKVSGLPDGVRLAYNYYTTTDSGTSSNWPGSKFFGNGITEIPAISIILTPDTEEDYCDCVPCRILYGGLANEESFSNVTIEILPLYPNALVSDGVDDYCYTDGLPILTDYTVIAKRKWIGFTNLCALASKMKKDGRVNGAFCLEHIGTNLTHEYWCFGNNNKNVLFPEEITYGTSTLYNGDSINKGNLPDNDVLSLFSTRENLQVAGKITLYSFLLFDRTLTTAEIEWVKKNMIESGGVLKTDWSDSSLWSFRDGIHVVNDKRVEGTLSSNIMAITSCITTNNFMEVIIENTQIPAYNIKVTGLKNGIILQYKDKSTGTYLYFNEDGIYTIPAHNTNGRWYGFSFNKTFENENIVIQQLLS